MPVPAGISLPMMTFSFKPTSGSTLPLMAASVRTLVVSWNEAADRKLSVASAALVIPSSSWVKVASLRPSSPAAMRFLIYSFSNSTSFLS